MYLAHDLVNFPAVLRNASDEASARYKCTPQDFKVAEILGFAPENKGPHLWLLISKTEKNTNDVVSDLSRVYKVSERDIGFSGLKDKNAVTEQWFSLPIDGEVIPETTALPPIDGVTYLQVTRNRKKLRRGVHAENSFSIRLSDVSADRDRINQKLDTIVKAGFPNYFDVQRFGTGGRNLERAHQMFSSRKRLSKSKRSIYLSSARSYLFNLVLADRIRAGNWNTVLPGEACMLDGSNSFFKTDDNAEDLQSRFDQLDIHTSGPMYGRGDSMVSDEVLSLETECLQSQDVFTQGLEAAGLSTDRRPLRAVAKDLSWQWPDNTSLVLRFTLSSGVYATAMLRELLEAKLPERTI